MRRHTLEPTWLALERPGDHARHVVRLNQQGTRDVTRGVKLVRPHDVLMRGDLKHRVGRRIHDPRTRAHVLRAERVDDRGATPDDIPDHGPPRSPVSYTHLTLPTSDLV